MRIYEKIKKIREDLGLTIQEVHDRCVSIFGRKEAMSYRTFLRIENGQVAKFSSILKICCALGVPLGELLKDTELEKRLAIKKKDRIDEYTYSEKVHASVVSSPSRSFLALELNLEPKGKTTLEQSPKESIFEKWIYVVEGQLICHLGGETFILTAKDTISFDSSMPHYFENKQKKKCICVLIQNPKYF
jgi:transcriptional regulator with XRE-family HTH domain